MPLDFVNISGMFRLNNLTFFIYSNRQDSTQPNFRLSGRNILSIKKRENPGWCTICSARSCSCNVSVAKNSYLILIITHNLNSFSLRLFTRNPVIVRRAESQFPAGEVENAQARDSWCGWCYE